MKLPRNSTISIQAQGIRVVFCDEVYEKANGDFDKWLAANHYPVSSHAGHSGHLRDVVPGAATRSWVRKDLVATALGDPMRKRGEAAGPECEAR